MAVAPWCQGGPSAASLDLLGSQRSTHWQAGQLESTSSAICNEGWNIPEYEATELLADMNMKIPECSDSQK